VTVDLVAALDPDVQDHRLKAAFRHLHRRTADTANDVMVVFLRSARDIGVFSGGQVQALEGALFSQQVERSKDGRSANLDAALLRVLEQIGRCEVALPRSDQGGDGPARPCLAHIDTRSH
jgi:hypothetical protein